jgi:hypothetical protein
VGRRETIEQPAEHRVGVGDLRVVGRAPARYSAGASYGACGSKRCTQANHGLPAFAWRIQSPAAFTTSAARRSVTLNVRVVLVWIAVVVLVEPAAEPEARVEDEGADKGPVR